RLGATPLEGRGPRRAAPARRGAAGAASGGVAAAAGGEAEVVGIPPRPAHRPLQAGPSRAGRPGRHGGARLGRGAALLAGPWRRSPPRAARLAVAAARHAPGPQPQPHRPWRRRPGRRVAGPGADALAGPVRLRDRRGGGGRPGAVAAPVAAVEPVIGPRPPRG